MTSLPPAVVEFLSQHGYLAAYVSMILTGPFGVLASGFAAGAGLLKIWIVWLISLVADLTTDVFYYTLGRRGGRRIVNYLSRKSEKTEKVMIRIESLFARHGGKMIFFIKFTHGIGTLTQILAGMSRMRFLYYILFSISGAAIKTAILIALGSAAGAAWEVWLRRFENVTISLTILTVLFATIFLVTTIFQRRVRKDLEKSG